MRIASEIKRYRSLSLTLICLCGLMLLSGCQKPIFTIHAYDGEHLSGDKLARVTKEQREQTGWDKVFSIYPEAIYIKTIDNLNPEEYEKGVSAFSCNLMVLPGEHIYGITFRGKGGVQAGAIPALIQAAVEGMKYGPLGTELTFNAETGHEYVIRFKEETKPWKGVVSVAYWVEDMNTDEVIVGDKPSGASSTYKTWSDVYPE